VRIFSVTGVLEADIEAGGCGQHGRIGAGDLDDAGTQLALMPATQPRLAAVEQGRVAVDHLRGRSIRTHLPAQAPERCVGDARHRSEYNLSMD
jgi:hypothetical protein